MPTWRTSGSYAAPDRRLGLQPERLRRDPARTVRGTSSASLPASRSPPVTAGSIPSTAPASCRRSPSRIARPMHDFASDADPRPLVRPVERRRGRRSVRRRHRPQGTRQAVRQDDPQGRDEEPSAGAREARPQLVDGDRRFRRDPPTWFRSTTSFARMIWMAWREHGRHVHRVLSARSFEPRPPAAIDKLPLRSCWPRKVVGVGSVGTRAWVLLLGGARRR